MKNLLILALTACSVGALAGTQLICRLDPTADPVAIGKKYGVPLVDVGYQAPFALYSVPAGVDPAAKQTAMSADPLVVWAEDDDQLTIPETQKGSHIEAIADRSSLYSQNANVMTQISWNSAAAQKTGREVRVAILDTGVGSKVRPLWAKTVAAYNTSENVQTAYDLPHYTDTNKNKIFDESVGHGTMVAGIIDQIAPQTKFIIVRVADSDGVSTAWKIIKGLTFAVAKGAEVANISLGSKTKIAALSDVLDWTETKGLLVVSPIGNDGKNIVNYPAGFGKVLMVSGVDDKDKKATFSNWDRKVLAAAPATGIKSTWYDNTVGMWSGTSFASPFVAATIADALRQRKTGLTPATLRSIAAIAGDNIDSLNPLYKRMLGLRLNVAKFQSQIINYSGTTNKVP